MYPLWPTRCRERHTNKTDELLAFRCALFLLSRLIFGLVSVFGLLPLVLLSLLLLGLFGSLLLSLGLLAFVVELLLCFFGLFLLLLCLCSIFHHRVFLTRGLGLRLRLLGLLVLLFLLLFLVACNRLARFLCLCLLLRLLSGLACCLVVGFLLLDRVLDVAQLALLR